MIIRYCLCVVSRSVRHVNSETFGTLVMEISETTNNSNSRLHHLLFVVEDEEARKHDQLNMHYFVEPMIVCLYVRHYLHNAHTCRNPTTDVGCLYEDRPTCRNLPSSEHFERERDKIACEQC